MPVYPHAKWEPISGHTDGPMNSHTGIVLHVNDAQSYDLHDFFNNPNNEVSSHFQVAKDGTVWQYLDTSVSSWCQGNGNHDYLSIESQGLAGESATDAQVVAIGGILAWVKQVHAIPLKLAERPGDHGFGWHGMGAAHGQPGWGHPSCPGIRKNQRTAMLAAALGHPPTEDDMPLTPADVSAVVAGVKKMLETGGVLADLNTQTTQLEQHLDPKLSGLQTQVASLKTTLVSLQTSVSHLQTGQVDASALAAALVSSGLPLTLATELAKHLVITAK